jgi:hypothetical protein
MPANLSAEPLIDLNAVITDLKDAFVERFQCPRRFSSGRIPT